MSENSDYDSTGDTLKHRARVADRINIAIAQLRERGKTHDESKLGNIEKHVFDIYTPKLKGITYGSDEYKANMAEMKVAIDNHNAANRHHPEHFGNGVNGMNLIDLIEMFCDWWAATERHADGNILKSIEIQQKRFGLSDDLKDVFLNTVDDFEDFEKNEIL